MNVKLVSIGFILVAVVLAGGFYLLGQSVNRIQVQPPLGSIGSEVVHEVLFKAPTTFQSVSAGGVLSATEAATLTITAAEVCNNGIIDWPIRTTDASTTLPDASELISRCLKSVGSYKDVLFRNTTSTAAAFTTLVGGTSSTVQINASSSLLQVLGTDEAVLRFQYVNSGSGEVDVYVLNYSTL